MKAFSIERCLCIIVLLSCIYNSNTQEVEDNNGIVPAKWAMAPEGGAHLRHGHKHHKHKHHGHHKEHSSQSNLVKGVDYHSHHESHGSQFDWNSFKPQNPTPKESMVMSLCNLY